MSLHDVAGNNAASDGQIKGKCSNHASGSRTRVQGTIKLSPYSFVTVM